MATSVGGRDYHVFTKPVFVTLGRPVPHNDVNGVEHPIVRRFVIMDPGDTTDLYSEPAVDLPSGLVHDAMLKIDHFQ